MFSEPIEHATPIEERRRTQRRKVNDLAYVSCGSENGGILLDVSEDGLSFHGIAALIEGNILEVKFVLPGQASAIEAIGEVVWSSDSKRGGGIRFVNLNEGARQQIRQWVSAGAASPDSKTQKPPAPQPFLAPVPSANPEPLRADGLLAAPAAPGSEAAMREVPDVPVVSREPANIHPQAPRTMFTEGLRRIHTVAPAPQEAPAEKVREGSPAAAEATPAVVLSGESERTSPNTLYMLGAALGCLVIIAVGLIGFRAQIGSGAASAGNGAASAAPVPSADEANRNFQVEVLDIHNKRLILSSDSSTSTTSVGPSDLVGQKVGAQSVSAASVTARPASLPALDASARKRSLQDLTLKTPSQLNRPSDRAEPQVPAVAAGVPPVASFGAPLVVTESPSQPPPPQAPAVIAPPKAGLQPAVLIKRVEPTYSAVARQARASGVVQVSATIGTDGVPRALRLVKGDARLAPPALEAIRQWRYRPAVLDGQAIETEALIQVEFQLPQ